MSEQRAALRPAGVLGRVVRWVRGTPWPETDPAHPNSPERRAKRAVHERLVAERGWDFGLRWKEIGFYSEGIGKACREVLFDVTMGDGLTLYVPTSDYWREVMPEWVRDRRDEVLSRIESVRGAVVIEETSSGYGPYPTV